MEVDSGYFGDSEFHDKMAQRGLRYGAVLSQCFPQTQVPKTYCASNERPVQSRVEGPVGLS